MLEKFGKKSTAVLAVIALLGLVGSVIGFGYSVAALPTVILDVEQRLTLNDDVTMAVARYTIGRAHSQYTYQEYIYRFALEYVLDIYSAATRIRPDAMMSVMVAEIKALPIEVGR